MSAETHELKLVPANVHWGYFDSRVKPVLKIASGDTVRVETMLAGVPDAKIPESLKQVEKAVTDRGPGVHPLTGPIYVDGAAPGDILEVHILALEFLHPYGVTGFRPGGGTLPNEFPYARFKQIHVDSKAGTAEFAPGIRLKITPFWGTIGVAPPAGIYRQSSTAPDANGGNLDNKELVVGSILYLPACICQCRLQADFYGRRPRGARRRRGDPDGPDLDEAARMATREIIDFLVSEKHLSRDE